MKLASPLTRVLAVAALSAMAVPAQSAEYCCTCKAEAQGNTIEAFNRTMAVGQCSLDCGAYTNVTSGKCAPPAAVPAPPTAAPTPAAAAPPAPATGVVLAYKSEDCSGDAVRLTGSAARLDRGVRSFLVESGAPASAWAQPNYAGRHTEPVGPSMCISPGFEIRSIRLQ